jgi:hypothetical protein
LEVKKMSYCDQINCGYYYKGEDDDFPCCHCPDDVNPAPCEDEGDYYEDDDCDYEVGYDPYMGCYTDDC